MLDPVAVALKFGFLAVLYLFLLWVARSRAARTCAAARRGAPAAPTTTTRPGMHAAVERSAAPAPAASRGCASRRAAGLRAGAAYDLSRRRAARAAATRPTSGSRTRSPRRATRGSSPHGDVIVLEDLGSTNGTYLNGEPLRGPQPLHLGDRIRIGDSEFTFER